MSETGVAAPVAAPALAPERAVTAAGPGHGERASLEACAAVGRLLGLDLGGRVVLDGASRPHGAAGAVLDGVIHLDPARWDAGTAEGRRVLAHEAVHLLQADPTRAGVGTADVATLRRAEAEADRIAREALAGRPAPKPRVRLARTAIPLDIGDHRLGDDAVRGAHPDLVRRLEEIVGDADPSRRDADAALDLLADQPLDVAAGAVHTLSTAARAALVDRITDDHRRGRRHAVLAVLTGLDRAQITALDADDLETLDLAGLEPAEHRAAVEILRSLRHGVLTELLTPGGRNAASIDRLLSEPLPGAPPAEPEDVEGIVARVREDVRTVSRAGSLRALARLGRLLGAAPGETAAGAGGGSGSGPSAPAPAPAAGAGAAAPAAGDERPADPRARLAEAVTAMAADGTLTRLVDGVGADRASLTDSQRAVLRDVEDLRGPVPTDAEGERIAARARDLLSRSFWDWAVTDGDALGALPLVLALARHHPTLLRRLDDEGKVATLFDELPDEVLYRADVRGQTGEIMAARREEILFEQAREKLSRGFFDWVITARDAYLASRMVEALSPDRREAFAELDGGSYAARLTDEMTASMRQAPDRHGFSAASAAAHREEVRTQLADPGTWSEERVESLRTLVVVAVTFGLGEWVFDRSREYRAHALPEVRRRVVIPFRLYDPSVGRTEFVPDRLTGTGFFSEGIFEGARAFAGGPGWLYGMVLGLSMLDGVSTTQDATHGTALVVSLEELAHEMGGGDLYGARFRSAEDAVREQGEAAHAGVQAPPERVEGTNTVRIVHQRPDTSGHGLLSVTSPAVELSGYRSVAVGGLLAFGGLRATGLRVAVGYSTGDSHRPTSLHVHADDLVIDDLVRGSEESLAAAAHLRAAPVDLRGGTGEIPERVGEARGNGSGFLHWLSPLLDEAFALLDLKDTWESQAAAVTAIEISLGSLDVTGLMVGGQRIERVAARDVHLGYGTDQVAYLHLLERSLGRRLARLEPGSPAADDLRTRLAEVRAEIATRQATASERESLEDRFQRDPAAMSPADRDRLRELRGTGGAVIDASSLTLEGVSGSADVASVALTGISGEARFRGRAPSVATAAARAQEFIDVGPPGLHDLDRPHVRLHVDRATFGEVVVPGDVPDDGALRDAVADLDEALEGAEEPARSTMTQRREALVRALEEDLPRYRALQERAAATAWGTGGADPAVRAVPLSVEEERERAALRARLRLLEAIRVRSGEIEHLEVGADLAGTVTDVAARALELQGVERGGLSLERVAGQDVSARIVADRPGVDGLQGLPGTLSEAQVAAGSLDVTGIRQDGVRLAEEVHLAGLAADVVRHPDGWEVRALHLDTVSVTGLRLVGGGRVITTFADDPALGGGTPSVIPEPTGGGTVELLGIDASGRLRTDEEGAPTGLTIASLAITEVRAPQPIRYREGARDLTLSAASIRGIAATGLEIPLAEGTVPLPTAGTLRVGELDQVAVGGRFAASVRAALHLDGAPASGTTLEVTFTPEGVELGHLDLPVLRVGGLVFDDGTRRVEIGGPATLRGITGRARVGITRGTDEEGEGTIERGAVVVPALDVATIEAPHVRYVEGARELEAAGAYHEPVATVRGLRVRDLRLSAANTFEGAVVDVDRATLGLAGTFAEGVVGGVEADVTAVHLEIGAGFREVSGSVGSSRARGGVVLDDGTAVGLDLSGLAVGSFRWEASTRTLHIGRSDPGGAGVVDGLTIDALTLTALSLDGPDLGLDLGPVGSGTVGGGAATLRGIRVAATVVFEAGPDDSVDWSHFRAELAEVHADSLSVEGLTVRLPGSGVQITLPAGMVATAEPIDIVPNIPELLLVERLPGPTGSRTEFQGRLEVGRVVVPRVETAVGGWLTGSSRIELDGLGVGRLSSGVVDLHLDEARVLGTHLAADLRAYGIGVIDPTAPPSPGLDLQRALDSAREALTPFASVLEHANGHLRADLTLHDLPAVGDWTERLDLTIVNGALNLHRLENALGNTGDLLLDFELEDPGLVLELDLSDVILAAGLGIGATTGGLGAPAAGGFIAGFGAGISPIGKVRLLTWDLTTGEQDVIRRDHLLPILRVLDARVAPVLQNTVRTATAGPASAGPSAFHLTNIDLRLDVLTPRAIPVSWPRPTGPRAPGSDPRLEQFDTVIPVNTLVGLTASGNLPGPAGRLALALRHLALGRTDVAVSGVAGGDLSVGLESLDVARAGAAVDFGGGPGGAGGSATAPTAATVDVASLTARGVDVRWIPGVSP